MKPICAAPFIGFHWKGNQSEDTSTMGSYFTCCETHDTRGIHFKPNTPFEEVFNNNYAKQIRQELLDGKWPRQCQSCKNILDTTGFDRRETYNKLATEDIEWNVEKGNGMKWIDIRPSNLCNQKCRMCSSFNSSLIAAEEKTLGIKVSNSYLFKKSSFDFVEHIPFQEMEFVKILGGEPLVQKETKDIISRVKDDCVVMITTNGNKPHADILSTALESKSKVIFNVSVDGVGKTYEYIRTNGRWNETKKFVESLPKEKINNVSMVPSLWNAFVLKDWFEWTEELGVKRFFHYTFQDWLSLSLLDEEDKFEIYQQLHQYPDFERMKHQMLKTPVNREELLQRFTMETRHLDKVRGTNILDLDPRFEKYLHD